MVVLVARAGAALALAALSFGALLDVGFFVIVPPANAGSPYSRRGITLQLSRRGRRARLLLRTTEMAAAVGCSAYWLDDSGRHRVADLLLDALVDVDEVLRTRRALELCRPRLSRRVEAVCRHSC